jgi:hypothetical protein
MCIIYIGKRKKGREREEEEGRTNKLLLASPNRTYE